MTSSKRSSGTTSDSEDVKGGIRRPAQRLWALFSNAQLPRSALPYVGYFRGGPETPGGECAQFPRGRLDPWTPLRQAGPHRQMKGARHIRTSVPER